MLHFLPEFFPVKLESSSCCRRFLNLADRVLEIGSAVFDQPWLLKPDMRGHWRRHPLGRSQSCLPCLSSFRLSSNAGFILLERWDLWSKWVTYMVRVLTRGFLMFHTSWSPLLEIDWIKLMTQVLAFADQKKKIESTRVTRKHWSGHLLISIVQLWQWFQKRHKKAMIEALEKIKSGN